MTIINVLWLSLGRCSCPEIISDIFPRNSLTCYRREENANKDGPRREAVHQNIGSWVFSSEVVLRFIWAVCDSISRIVIVIDDVVHENATRHSFDTPHRVDFILLKIFIALIIIFSRLILEQFCGVRFPHTKLVPKHGSIHRVLVTIVHFFHKPVAHHTDTEIKFD